MEEPVPSPEQIGATDSDDVSWGRVLITLAGLGLGAYLVVEHGWIEVLRALQEVGWPGLAAITLFHVLPTLVCGLAWWNLLRPHLDERWPLFVWLRWIRDGTDGVVPILPVSGELIATRLLRLRGTAMAGAGVIVDVTTELLAQLLFAVLGFALLVTTHRDSHHLSWIVLGLGVMTVQFGGFLIAQRKGLFRLLERPFDWIRRRWRGADTEAPEEVSAERTLHDQILQLHANHRAFFGSILLHLAAWIIGALEAWIALRLMGHPLDVPDVLVLESLVTAIRSIIFFVPLAAGVQEAGYVLVGGLLGLPAGIALAVSLVKRARDLIKGVPAVLLWQLLERRAARRTAVRAVSGPSA
ncbi:MAG TPA: lysylphosphatidylglycerol synthase domain-containing protein [Steroidobacteraceae bacterium]|nr:lysylphosphatidylglycerol synthase domain-containing protein [Steroidobacteraceae bacterium]